ncbi:MAG: tRNA adenosine(34) deaminase TadA [Woeseiaceae bacterium]|nr:tRNA adenosine(34) deaminase TadA [Woeseiaceae bacterium]
MGWSETDLSTMRAAIDAARAGAEAGEVPVGAAILIGDSIVATAHNRTIVDQDPTGHAEIVALRKAADRIGNYRLTNATLYVTLEPCTMCMGAMNEARVSRLVFGAYDAKAGAAGSMLDLSDSLPNRFEVNGGVLEDECAALLKEFFEARRSGRGD